MKKSSDTDTHIEDMLNTEVQLENAYVGLRGNVRGAVKGTCYNASVPKASAMSYGIYNGRYDFSDKTIMIKLTRWDENAQVFNAEIVSIDKIL